MDNLFTNPSPATQEEKALMEKAESVLGNFLARKSNVEDIVKIVTLQLEKQQTVSLPASLMSFLHYILKEMSEGRRVYLLPENAELSTQQAAEILGVSRPYLIKLLKNGEMDYKKVGSHRRLKASVVMDYKQSMDKKRSDALDELVQLSKDLGDW